MFYCFNFSAFIRLFARVSIETNVNTCISSKLNYASLFILHAPPRYYRISGYMLLSILDLSAGYRIWLRGYKKYFSRSTQLSMKLFLLINVELPTVVGILTFMSREKSILGLSESEKKAEFLILMSI